jgi:hypothetical protein
MARFVSGPAEPDSAANEVGQLTAPYPGETVCGDGWGMRSAGGSATLMLVDGLGHGPQAAEAAEMAMRTFSLQGDRDCVQLMEMIHRALVPTRGAAIAIARIDRGERLVRFVGVGNIAGMLIDGGELRRMVSNNGTAGHIAPRIREFTYPFTRVPLVILHSDGLTTKWELGAYPGLASGPPSLIAGVLFRDFRRERDDASVLAVRVGS